MKFNVHKWNGKEWIYLATAVAPNEQIAAKMVSTKYGILGRFASYPHMDNSTSSATSTTLYTSIHTANSND